MKNASAPSNFPERLVVLLEESGDKGFGNVIRWLPNGNGFQVLSREMMEETVIPQYFGATRWKSFQRQLNLYGFRSIKDPISKERYFHHPHFRRDQQHQLNSTIMKRQRTTNDADVTRTNAPSLSTTTTRKKMSPPDSPPVLHSSTMIAKSTTQQQKPEKYRITAGTAQATTTRKAPAEPHFVYYPREEQQEDHQHRWQHDGSGGNHDENPAIGEDQERKMTPPIDNSAHRQEFTRNDIIKEIISTFLARR